MLKSDGSEQSRLQLSVRICQRRSGRLSDQITHYRDLPCSVDTTWIVRKSARRVRGFSQTNFHDALALIIFGASSFLDRRRAVPVH